MLVLYKLLADELVLVRPFRALHPHELVVAASACLPHKRSHFICGFAVSASNCVSSLILFLLVVEGDCSSV